MSSARVDYWGGYYDFLINEGSYKFWAVFQVIFLYYSAKCYRNIFLFLEFKVKNRDYHKITWVVTVNFENMVKSVGEKSFNFKLCHF